MVRPLRAAGIGVKKIITHLEQSHPNLKVGSREVREALRQLDEAANESTAPPSVGISFGDSEREHSAWANLLDNPRLAVMLMIKVGYDSLTDGSQLTMHKFDTWTAKEQRALVPRLPLPQSIELARGCCPCDNFTLLTLISRGL